MIDNKAFRNISVEPHRPIEFLTENGFGIIRLSDIDKSIPAVGATHEFLVRDPHEYELHITVQISSDAIAEVGGEAEVAYPMRAPTGFLLRNDTWLRICGRTTIIHRMQSLKSKA